MDWTGLADKAYSFMRSNKAFGEISALGKQAKSYAGGAARRAKGIATDMVSNATNVRRNALIGAGAGGAAGVGYDYTTNDDSDIRSKIKAGLGGAVLGGAAGAGYSYGRQLPDPRKGAQSMWASAKSGAESAYGRATGGIRDSWRGASTRSMMRQRGFLPKNNRMLGAGSPFAMGSSSM
jgi:hypothetical protein